MTQEEEKQLLIKDICMRLPYGVRINISSDYTSTMECMELNAYHLAAASYNIEYRGLRPYLRSMSSMTEEERKELKNVTCPNGTGYFNEQYLVCPVNHFGEQISFDFMSDIIDWLNSHHFDYRGLIPMGLALEAKEGMYTNGEKHEGSC